MANPYTTTNLIASMKLRGYIPTGTNLSNTDFLRVLNDELQGYMVDLLMEIGEEYLVAKDATDYSITANQNVYALPSRAVDGMVRKVEISDTTTAFRQLPRTEPTWEEDFANTGGPQAYKVEGNNLVLLPTPTSTSGTLRVKPYLRPNRLVLDTSDTAAITAINTGAKQVTIATTPSTFLTTATTYDFIGGNPGFDWVGIDYSATRSGSVLTFTSTLPTGLAVGDYVALQGESPIPQLPVSLHPVLATRAGAVLMEAMGDRRCEGLYQKCEIARARALNRMKPRVPGSGRVIVNRFGPGWGA